MLVLSNIAYSEVIDLDLSCSRDFCIPNRYTEWNLTINHKGEATLRILGFKIIDAVDKKEIFTQESERPVEIITSKTITAFQKLPFANSKGAFIANICLITQPEEEAWAKAGKRIEYCYNDLNYSINITDCIEHSDCTEDSICTDKKCNKLDCGYCGYASFHLCRQYECCADSECQKNQRCDSHKCADLKCKENEFLINHTCSVTRCLDNESIVNFSCVPLDCKEDEYLSNHECLPLNCLETQGIYDHNCTELNCSIFEFASDHTCNKLNCSENEAFLNHTCQTLDCNFLKVAEGHECRINSLLIINSFLIFVVFFLVFLNLETYLYRRRKKIVDFLMAKRKGENIKTSGTDIKPNGQSGNANAAAGEQGKDNGAGK